MALTGWLQVVLSITAVLVLLAAAILIVHLVYTLLRPEKF